MARWIKFRASDSWVVRELDQLPRGKKTQTIYRALGEYFLRQRMEGKGLDESVELLEQIYKAIYKAGVNLNQIARRVNQSSLEDPDAREAYLEAIENMRRVTNEVDRLIDHWKV